MENYPHRCFSFSTAEDTLLCHTWFVLVYLCLVLLALVLDFCCTFYSDRLLFLFFLSFFILIIIMMCKIM